MFVVMGLGAAVTSAIGFLIRPLRNVEQDIPDAIPDEVGEEAVVAAKV